MASKEATSFLPIHQRAEKVHWSICSETTATATSPNTKAPLSLLPTNTLTPGLSEPVVPLLHV